MTPVLVSHLVLFALVYNISFMAIPPVSTGRVAMLFLIWVYRKSLLEMAAIIFREHPLPLIVFTAALVHAVAGSLAGGLADTTQASRQFHFLFYSVLGSILYVHSIGYDRDRFMRRFSRIAFLQSCFIIYSMFDFEYREWLSTILVAGGNLGLAEGFRPPGFTNSTGANLSVIQSLGVFASLWSAMKASSVRASTFHYFCSLVGFVSAFLTGRTGLLLCALFAATFCLHGLFKKRPGPAIVLGSIVLVIITFGPDLLFFLSSLQSQSLPNFERFTAWALEFFISGANTSSVQELSQMRVPPLNWETFVGTGLVYIDNVRVSDHDSGYIQTYFSLGLLVAAAFYGALATLFAKLWDRADMKFLLGSLGVSMFLIELKEPFIFKYIFPFFLFCLLYSLDPYAHGKAEVGRERPSLV